jgi:hypothetical protein
MRKVEANATHRAIEAPSAVLPPTPTSTPTYFGIGIKVIVRSGVLQIAIAIFIIEISHWFNACNRW